MCGRKACYEKWKHLAAKVGGVGLAAVILLMSVSCSAQSAGNLSSLGSVSSQSSVTSVVSVTAPDAQAKAGDAVSADCTITLSDAGSTASGSGVQVDGSVITVTQAGTYAVTGSLSDGQLQVNTQQEQTVTLYFNGVDLTCSDGPAVYILNAPKKVVIEAVKNSVNKLCDGASYALEGQDDAPTACLFSKEDLDLQGDGTLYVTGISHKGIFSKDDLSIEGGQIIVSSADDGIRGKDSVTVSGGTLQITSGADGLRTSNETDTGKGNMSITGGTLTISAGQDCIQSVGSLTIDGGTFTLTSGGGSTNAATKTDSAFGFGGGMQGGGMQGGGMQGGGAGMPGDVQSGTVPSDVPSGTVPSGMPDGTAPSDVQSAASGTVPGNGGQGGGMQGGPGNMGGQTGGFNSLSSAADSTTDTTTQDTTSQKAIKATGAVTITGGSFTIDCADDAVHSNDSITVTGGSFAISSGDDGIHADATLTISGGEINIAQSYEGLEASDLEISGGNITVTASDDGLNAAGGNDGSSVNGRPGQNGFDSADGSLIQISGGYLVVSAAGDGIDSNGDINMTGGKVIVYGPTDDANGPLDYAGTFTFTDGWLMACGSSGMAQSVTNNSSYGVVACTFGSVSAGTMLYISDSSGNTLLAFQSEKSFTSVVFISPQTVSGQSYTVCTGGSCTGTAQNGVYDGSCSGGTALGTITAS